jgi:glycosyltransferase involved in cell wall biosynthesis
MKVAFCTGWNAGRDGIADYSRHLVEGLRAEGISVDICALYQYRGGRDFYRRLAEQANRADLCHVQYNYVYFNGDLPYRNRFNYFSGRLKVPLVATVHEVRPGYSRLDGPQEHPFKSALFNATLPFWDRWSHAYHRKAYGRMDRILVHTRCQSERISRELKQPDKIVLMPHGIPAADAHYAGIDPDAAKRSFGLEGKDVLGIFGFINKRKGYETALEALAGLDERSVLLIAGGPMTDNQVDQVYYRRLLSLIAEKKLSARVVITGYLSEEKIALAMAATDICLAPFDSDAASGALSLCLSYGKPIVASDIPVNEEINSRVACLELFAREDHLALEKSIRRCISDQERRNQLRAGAAQYAQEYSFGAVARQLHAVYRRLLDERKGR